MVCSLCKELYMDMDMDMVHRRGGAHLAYTLQAPPHLDRRALRHDSVALLGCGRRPGGLHQPRSKRVQQRRIRSGQVAEAAAGRRAAVRLPAVRTDQSAGSGHGL